MKVEESTLTIILCQRLKNVQTNKWYPGLLLSLVFFCFLILENTKLTLYVQIVLIKYFSTILEFTVNCMDTILPSPI